MDPYRTGGTAIIHLALIGPNLKDCTTGSPAIVILHDIIQRSICKVQGFDHVGRVSSQIVKLWEVNTGYSGLFDIPDSTPNIPYCVIL